MSANYPTSPPSFTNKSAGQTIGSAHINSLQDEVAAIGGGLLQGTAPLNSSNSTVANLTVTGNSTFTGNVHIVNNQQIDGNSTVNGNHVVTGNVTVGGIIATHGAIYRQAFETIVLSSGNTNDLTIQSSVTIAEISGPAGGSTLTGIRIGQHGRTVTLVNTGGFPWVIAQQNAGSSAENRIQCPRSSNLSIDAGCAVDAYYSTISNLWRIISGTRSV